MWSWVSCVCKFYNRLFISVDKVRLISINKTYVDIINMLLHKDGYDYKILGMICWKVHIEQGLTFDYQEIK